MPFQLISVYLKCKRELSRAKLHGKMSALINFHTDCLSILNSSSCRILWCSFGLPLRAHTTTNFQSVTEILKTPEYDWTVYGYTRPSPKWCDNLFSCVQRFDALQFISLAATKKKNNWILFSRHSSIICLYFDRQLL